jgi:hypothetical protein
MMEQTSYEKELQQIHKYHDTFSFIYDDSRHHWEDEDLSLNLFFSKFPSKLIRFVITDVKGMEKLTMQANLSPKCLSMFSNRRELQVYVNSHLQEASTLFNFYWTMDNGRDVGDYTIQHVLVHDIHFREQKAVISVYYFINTLKKDTIVSVPCRNWCVNFDTEYLNKKIKNRPNDVDLYFNIEAPEFDTVCVKDIKKGEATLCFNKIIKL